jgi:hypothetical protein
MVTGFATIFQRAAERIALRFSDAVFMPPVGEPVPCKAEKVTETDLQPAGISSVSDVKKMAIVFLKSQVSEDIAIPGGYFTIDSVDYFIEAVAESDNDYLGKVIVKSAD